MHKIKDKEAKWNWEKVKTGESDSRNDGPQLTNRNRCHVATVPSARASLVLLPPARPVRASPTARYSFVLPLPSCAGPGLPISFHFSPFHTTQITSPHPERRPLRQGSRAAAAVSRLRLVFDAVSSSSPWWCCCSLSRQMGRGPADGIWCFDGAVLLDWVGMSGGGGLDGNGKRGRGFSFGFGVAFRPGFFASVMSTVPVAPSSRRSRRRRDSDLSTWVEERGRSLVLIRFLTTTSNR